MSPMIIKKKARERTPPKDDDNDSYVPALAKRTSFIRQFNFKPYIAVGGGNDDSSSNNNQVIKRKKEDVEASEGMMGDSEEDIVGILSEGDSAAP